MYRSTDKQMTKRLYLNKWYYFYMKEWVTVLDVLQKALKGIVQKICS